MDDEDHLSCKDCGGAMEEMRAVYLTRIRPLKTYRCQHCNRRLLEFAATPRPLRLSSRNFAGVVDFSALVEESAKEKNLTLILSSSFT